MSDGLREFQRNGSKWLVERVVTTTRRPLTLGLCDEVGLGKTHVAADAAWRLLDRGFRLLVYVSPNLTLAEQNRPKIANQAITITGDAAGAPRGKEVVGGSRLTLLLPGALLGRRGGVVDVSRAARQDEELRPTAGILVSAHTSLRLAGKGLRRERTWLRALLQWYRRRFAHSRQARRDLDRFCRTLTEADKELRYSDEASGRAYARMLRRQPPRRRRAIARFVEQWLKHVGAEPSVRELREAYRQQLLRRVGPVVWLVDEYQQYAELFRDLASDREDSNDVFVVMSATPFEVPEDADGGLEHEGIRTFLQMLDEQLARRLFGGDENAFEEHWSKIRALVRAFAEERIDAMGLRARVKQIRRDHVEPLERQLTRVLTRHERPPASVPRGSPAGAPDWKAWLTSYGCLEQLGADLSKHVWTTELWTHAPSFPLTSGSAYKASEAVARAPRSGVARVAARLQPVLPLENATATFKSAGFTAELRRRLQRPSGNRSVRPIWLAPSARGVPGKLVVFTRYRGSARDAVLTAEAVNGRAVRTPGKQKRTPFRLGLRDAAWPFFWPGWASILERITRTSPGRTVRYRSLQSVLDADLRLFARLQRRADAGDAQATYLARALALHDWKSWDAVRRDLRGLHEELREGFGGTALAAFARHAKGALDVSVQYSSTEVPNVVPISHVSPPTDCLGTALIDALLRLCEAEGVAATEALPLLVQRWARILEALLAFAHYFRRESVQRARGLGATKRWTERGYLRSLAAAVRDDDLAGAIQELAFTLQPVRRSDATPLERSAASIDALLERLISVLEMDDQRLGILVRGRGETGSLRHTLVPCGMGMTLGDEEADDSKPERRSTERKIDAFNSPFFPFCIVLGGAAEHGLDFHHFCDGVVHWDAPRSAVHWEQRIGRVIRFRHLALRRYLLRQLANGEYPTNLVKVLERAFEDHEGGDGRVPDWQAPLVSGETPQESWPVEVMLAMPGTAEHATVERIERERAFLRLSLGHPDRVRFLEVMEREARSLNAEQRKVLEAALSELVLDLRPRGRRVRRGNRQRLRRAANRE